METSIWSILAILLGTVVLLAALGEAGLALVSALRRSFQRQDVFDSQLERFEEELMTARVRRVDRARESASWNGYRKFRVARKVPENEGISSFYLAAHDGKPIPGYRPGQYLTFGLKPAGERKPVVRCYSLSDAPDPNGYRVTIKRLGAPPDDPDAPPGKGSCFFHDTLREGDILDVKSPAGDFVLDLTKHTPIVLIAGGVGVTPLLSMLNASAQRGLDREVWFFYGVHVPADQIMSEHLAVLSEQYPEHLNVHVCVSGIAREDLPQAPRIEHHAEHVSVELMKRLLPSSNFDFYICGPPPMMDDITRDLREWGVPDDNVYFESFGAETVKNTLKASEVAASAQAGVNVRFARSDVEVQWGPDCGTLLELAEANGVAIDSGCRAGSCSSCTTAIKSGEVSYLTPPGEEPDAGSCLACISVPKSDIELDA